MTDAQKILAKCEFDYDADIKFDEENDMTNWHGRRLLPTIRALLTDRERLIEALEKVKSKEGFCIFGTTDLLLDPEQAFRQGSAYTYVECAALTKEALAQSMQTTKEILGERE